MKNKMRIQKIMNKVRNTLFLATGMSLMFIHEAQCSNALKSFTEGTNTIHGLVMGPLGATVLGSGTLIGTFAAAKAGNWMIAAAILLVGVLAGYQIETINSLFTVKN